MQIATGLSYHTVRQLWRSVTSYSKLTCSTGLFTDLQSTFELLHLPFSKAPSENNLWKGCMSKGVHVVFSSKAESLRCAGGYKNRVKK